MDRPSTIMINLGDVTARNGLQQMLFRCTRGDKTDIEAASKYLGMSGAQFIRMVAIQAARKVLAERY